MKEILASTSWKKILQQPLDNVNFVIFDLEATGGNPLKSGLTEIFAMEFCEDGPSQKKFHSLVNPKRRIPPIVRKLTNITNKMVENAPEAEALMPDFFHFIEGKILVSHNTLCDLKFLNHYSNKLRKKPLENFFLCTHLLSEKLLAESKFKSLSGLCEFLGFKVGPTHRATEDTVCTSQLFSHLLSKLKERNIQTLEEAINFQGDLASAIRLGWDIPKKDIEAVPSQLGVLNFKKNSKELLFSIASHNCLKTFYDLKDLSELPKQLARSLTKAHKLVYKRHDNILEAKLEAAAFTASQKNLFDPLRINPSYALGLAITSRQEDLYEACITHPKEKNIFFYGPLFDFKGGNRFLQSLAKEVFAKDFSRDKLYLTKKELELLLLILNKQKFLYLFQSLKSHLLERNLSNYFKTVKDFSKLEKQHAVSRQLRDLRKDSGLLFIKNRDLTSTWKVYSIIRGVPGDILTVDSFYDSWLSTPQGLEYVKVFLSKVLKEKNLVGRILSRKEASTINLVLWFVHTQATPKNKRNACFISKETLMQL